MSRIVGTAIRDDGGLDLSLLLQQQHASALFASELARAGAASRAALVQRGIEYIATQAGAGTEGGSPLSNLAPSALSDSYRGEVSGNVNSIYAGWTIAALKISGGFTVVTPSSAIVAGDGTFTVSLASTSTEVLGSWALELVDENFATGISALPCRPLNALESVQLGAEWPLDTNLTGASVEEHATALMAAMAAGYGGLASALATALLGLQAPAGDASAGGFLFSAVTEGSPSYRTGAQAVAVFALLRYVLAFPDDDSQDWAGAVTAGLGWLATQLSDSGTTAGLYLPGTGTDSASPLLVGQDVTFSTAYATDNIKAWFALDLAAEVLGDDDLQAQADSLQSAIMTSLWNGAGFASMLSSGPGTVAALEAAALGSLFLNATGQDSRAASAISQAALASLQVTQPGPPLLTGYQPYVTSSPTIWTTGTAQVAYALAVLGDTRWPGTVGQLAALQDPSGGEFYVTAPADDLSTELDVGATAMSVLAALAQGYF